MYAKHYEVLHINLYGEVDGATTWERYAQFWE